MALFLASNITSLVWVLKQFLIISKVKFLTLCLTNNGFAFKNKSKRKLYTENVLNILMKIINLKNRRKISEIIF